MNRRPLASAITAVLQPWTDGKFEVWWFGTTVTAGHDTWTDCSMGAARWTLVPA